MIILDTNVVSGLVNFKPDPVVEAWFNTLNSDNVWITSITVFEAARGAGLMPQGKRRERLEAALAALLEQDFEGRVLSFDSKAALAAATLASKRRKAGLNIDSHDTQIAGIALAQGATLATRNTRHFRDTGLALVNPWEAAD